eukprot:7780564-Pyramimonas_sp.AAC.1
MPATAWQEQLADQAAVNIGADAVDLSHAKAAPADTIVTTQGRSLLVSYHCQADLDQVQAQRCRA